MTQTSHIESTEHREAPADPHRNLWVAVLRQALDDATYEKPPHTNVPLHVHHYAIDWFKSDRDGVGSFLWVCTILDFDPDRIRRYLFVNPMPMLRVVIPKKPQLKEGRAMTNLCSVEGCDGKVIARGLCTKCYGKWRSGNSEMLELMGGPFARVDQLPAPPIGSFPTLQPSAPDTHGQDLQEDIPANPTEINGESAFSEGSCKIPGCNEKAKGCGLCSSHYDKWRKGTKDMVSILGPFERKLNYPPRRKKASKPVKRIQAPGFDAPVVGGDTPSEIVTAIRLSSEHWEWIHDLLTTHGEAESTLRMIGFHYRSAFVHGYKHGRADHVSVRGEALPGAGA